jgi:hypothetical protein
LSCYAGDQCRFHSCVSPARRRSTTSWR